MGKASGHTTKPDQDYCIFTANGQRHTVRARSLRTAVRQFDKKGQGEIVAVCEMGCMPAAPAEERPFMALFLKVSNFQAPDIGD